MEIWESANAEIPELLTNVPPFCNPPKSSNNVPLFVRLEPDMLVNCDSTTIPGDENSPKIMIPPLLELAPEAKLKLPPDLMLSEVAVPRVRLSMVPLRRSIVTTELGALIATL